jgi:hypothetical protein
VVRILGVVSSVIDGDVLVHFKVVVSEEYESSGLRRWMR